MTRTALAVGFQLLKLDHLVFGWWPGRPFEGLAVVAEVAGGPVVAEAAGGFVCDDGEHGCVGGDGAEADPSGLVVRDAGMARHGVIPFRRTKEDEITN